MTGQERIIDYLNQSDSDATVEEIARATDTKEDYVKKVKRDMETYVVNEAEETIKRYKDEN